MRPILTGSVPFNNHVTIDETPGVESQALLYNAQLIQTYRFNDNVILESNTFFDFLDSENHEPYYYADNDFLAMNDLITPELRLQAKF